MFAKPELTASSWLGCTENLAGDDGSIEPCIVLSALAVGFGSLAESIHRDLYPRNTTLPVRMHDACYVRIWRLSWPLHADPGFPGLPPLLQDDQHPPNYAFANALDPVASMLKKT